MTTPNKSSGLEIFETINKFTKLSFENQFRFIIALFYSMNDRYLEDTNNIFISKCQEFHKERKSDQLTRSTVDHITLMIYSFDVLKNDNFFTSIFIPFLISTQNKPDEFEEEYKVKEPADYNHIAELESFMENIQNETIEFERILQDLGPFIVNNSIPLKSDIIDFKIDEKRLASFILFLCKNQNWVEDKENRYLNKVFLKSLNNDLSMTIDENNEKKNNTTWNIENFYKCIRKQIDAMDVSIL